MSSLLSGLRREEKTCKAFDVKRSRKGLVPAAKDGFAAELAGTTSLQDVDADLTRSLADDQQPADQQ